MMSLLLLLACSSPADPSPADPSPVQAAAPAPTEVTARGGRARPGDAAPADDAAITITRPKGGDAFDASGVVAGTAMVYEGRLTVEIHQGGAILFSEELSAGVSAPSRGEWSLDAALPGDATGEATVRAYSRSAKDGSAENVVEVPIRLLGNRRQR